MRTPTMKAMLYVPMWLRGASELGGPHKAFWLRNAEAYRVRHPDIVRLDGLQSARVRRWKVGSLNFVARGAGAIVVQCLRI